MKTVAILEGWAGGPWHTRQFRQLLKKAGFVVAKVEDAEIIIAHSAGIFDIPSNRQAKVIIMIGVPY